MVTITKIGVDELLGGSRGKTRSGTTQNSMPQTNSISGHSVAISRVSTATAEKPIKNGPADERTWDGRISIAIGSPEKPKISTLPFTGEPPALMLLSATAATNQQEGRYRPTAVSASKQTKKQSSLVTERADEADKMLVSSPYRQQQQALATERADEADKMLVPSASRQAAQSTITSSTKQQEGRSRPVAPAVRQITQEEWAAQQRNALTQKINDAQTKLDAANARYASVARYGTVEDRISLRTEIRDLEQQIKDLEKERGDPNLLERLSKTLSGTVEQYFGSLTNTAGVAAEAQKGTAMSGVYQAQVESLDQQIAALERTLNDPTMTEQDIADTNEALRIAREQRALYGNAVRAGEGTAREVYHLADELSASGAKDLERAKEGASTVGSVGIDLLSQGTQMGMDAALGMISGGGTLAPMALRSFGSGAQEARQNGADLQQAVNYGAASAAVEVLTEKMFDGLAGLYGKGAADDIVEAAINKLTTDETARNALKIAAAAAGESFEEFVSGIVNPALKSLYNGKSIGENYSELEWKAVLYDALIGGIMGGVGGAVDVARGGVSTSGAEQTEQTQKTASAEAAAKAAQAVEELGAKPSVAQTEVEANRLLGYGEQDVARREQFRTAEQTARKFGAELEVAELPSGVDGEYRDGKIIISPRATNPVMTVAVHELTHHMESSSRYGEFSRMVLDYVSNEMGVDVDAMKNAIRSEYARGGFELDDVGAERELVAKFAESKLFQDEAAINRLARTNRSMLQTVKDWISDMVVKLTGTEEEKFFRNAERMYEKALREVDDTTNSNGGRVQYSINPSFADDVQAWNDAGQPSGDSFILGTTGDTLQGLGAIESDIFMNGDKISTIFAEHPEITLEEIKRIPEILDDPVLILKSKGHGSNGSNTRIVVFGSVRAQNGLPVLSILDLRPVEGNFVIDDLQKVSSAYTKDRNPANFVSQSDVIYADEKRTVPLLRTMGLQYRPIELQRYGSLGSISYDGQNVNINGVPFSSLFLNQNASNGVNTSNSYGRSFDEFAGDAQRLPTMDDSTSYADTFREMQPPGARQSASYADDLAHVNELLQNTTLSPRDQAYIQEDIADAQRSCDAAMKVIADPGTTAEERAQAIRRAIDALDYARQRINDLGLPATQLVAGTAQNALAEIAERLKPYLDELGGFHEP